MKKCQIPKNLKILTLGSDLGSPTQRAPNWSARYIDLFWPGAVHERTDNTGSSILYSRLEPLEVKYGEFEKSARTLRSSKFWHCFQIRCIPLLSASNWHVNAGTYSGQALIQFKPKTPPAIGRSGVIIISPHNHPDKG